MRFPWIWRFFLPLHAEKERELRQASTRVTLTISRYRDTSREIQEEIGRNRFAQYLIYDRGDAHERN
ncbi:hypothetical protein [Paenibacillus durus]|uniref:Uncharacterized protein n=1 Tax=Paenibacillus durus TaxID=44251 RepID=A0A089HU51_PAEDU|nr:hypothetical protein [Paenibacillus durus]AIQ14617.1 hypothetical protein PDUR_24050 [Paenibacillus durus]